MVSTYTGDLRIVFNFLPQVLDMGINCPIVTFKFPVKGNFDKFVAGKYLAGILDERRRILRSLGVNSLHDLFCRTIFFSKFHHQIAVPP